MPPDARRPNGFLRSLQRHNAIYDNGDSCRQVNSTENHQQSFVCWQPANAPILSGLAQSFHIDQRMPLPG